MLMNIMNLIIAVTVMIVFQEQFETDTFNDQVRVIEP